MEQAVKREETVNVYELIQAFKKIYANLNPNNLKPVEEQLSIIMPLPESKVVTKVGYRKSENRVSITFFVSKAKNANVSKEHKFIETITQLLLKTNLNELIYLKEYLINLEKSGKNYRLNGTYSEYDDELGDYTFYLFIFKE